MLETWLEPIYKKLDDAKKIMDRVARSPGIDAVAAEEITAVGKITEEARALIIELHNEHQRELQGCSNIIDRLKADIAAAPVVSDYVQGEYEMELFHTYPSVEKKVMAFIKRPDIKVLSISHSFLRDNLTVMVIYKVIK